MKAGIGAAIGVAVLALIFAGVAIVMLRRNKREKNRRSTGYVMETRMRMDDPVEVNGWNNVSELPASTQIHELPGGWPQGKETKERQAF